MEDGNNSFPARNSCTDNTIARIPKHKGELLRQLVQFEGAGLSEDADLNMEANATSAGTTAGQRPGRTLLYVVYTIAYCTASAAIKSSTL